MAGLKGQLERLAPHFEEGGRLATFKPVFEMVDTLLYTPASVTRTAAHVRDGLDLKRMMMAVVIALMPCMVWAAYNTGYQIHTTVAAGGTPLAGWRTQLLLGLGFALDPGDALACLVHGALYYLPVLVVTFAAGGAVEITFAILRKHPVNEGFFVTGMLFPLTLPPTIPLWQVALGVAFGLLFGKEVFGGTGMNFLNPALLSRAFLFFAYPADISGDRVWVAANVAQVDAVSSATLLAQATVDRGALAAASWWDAFWGFIPGSMGETSTAACALGAAFLVLTRIASWRTMLGVALGSWLLSLLFNVLGSESNPMFAIPFHWHVVLGGWALGAAFMATDPVTSAFTETGKLVYGLCIGVLIVLIRVVNPAYPEGTMLAILFMNMFAPVIDHVAVRANIRRRRLRGSSHA